MLVFARHGECVANSERRYVGRSESPLTERGRRQARRLAALLAGDGGLELDRIVSSPLGRALETAEAVARALAPAGEKPPAVVVDDRFAEIDYGGLDGSLLDGSLLAGSLIADSSRAGSLPQGESLEEAAERVQVACSELWAELAGGGRSMLVVSHVLPIKLAVCWALDVPPAAVWRMTLAVASLTRVSTAGASPALASYNENAFLGEDRSPSIWR